MKLEPEDMGVDEAIALSTTADRIVYLRYTSALDSRLAAACDGYDSDDDATQIDFWGDDWRIVLVR